MYTNSENTETNRPVSSNFKLMDGIPGWGQGILIVTATLQDDCIVFSKTVSPKSPTVSLKLEQVTETKMYTEREIIEKSKSVVGRAAVGSLFGPLGAIIGAVSGTGKKKRVLTDTYYTISYISSSNAPAMITLKCGVMGCHEYKFNSALSAALKKYNLPCDENAFL